MHHLFSGTPVRRKFLKTQATEFGHLSEQFTRVALAHPRLHAVLRHNNKTVYELPATTQLLDRLRLFYGADLADKLISVESQAGDVRMWGYVGHPCQSKSTRNHSPDLLRAGRAGPLVRFDEESHRRQR